MLKLKYLVLLASFLYMLVIGGSIAAFRYWFAYPNELQSSTTLYRSNESALKLALKEKLINLRASLDDIIDNNLEQTKWSNEALIRHKLLAFLVISDGPKIETMTSSSLWFSQPDQLERDLKTQGEWPFKVNTGYLEGSRGPMAFAIRKIHNSDHFAMVIVNLDTSWLSSLKKSVNGQLRLVKFPDVGAYSVNEQTDTASHDDLFTHYLLNPKGDIAAQLQLKHSIPLPRLWDTQTIIGTLSLIVLPLIITLFVHFLFVVPVVTMIRKLQQMSGGVDPVELNLHLYIYELDEFKRAFNQLVSRINHHQEQLIRESLTDGLTGIPNRRAFDEQLKEAWNFCARTQVPIAVAIIDIDYFKRFNDEYGHQQGDEALQAVALCLRSRCRRASEFVARYGGEEFAFIIQGMSIEELNGFLENMLQSIRRLKVEHKKSGVYPYLTISAGATLLETRSNWVQHNMPKSLIEAADEALYSAKNSGRNKYELNAFRGEAQDPAEDTFY